MSNRDVQLRIWRIYDPSDSQDGTRILVDRMWPRGVSKANAALDYWARDSAPSNELRQWYGHAHERWSEFRERYHAELEQKPEAVAALLGALRPGNNTLLFGSKETRLNNAAALADYLREKLKED